MKRFFYGSRFAISVLVLSLLMVAPSLLADSGANHRVRNLHFGVSGGNVNDSTRRFCCSGTLGSLVQAGGNQYILSNNHVLGLAGAASVGDAISQPGLIDNNCQVSTVVANFTVAPALSLNVDCAIAQLIPGRMDATGSIEDIGPITSAPQAPTVGLSVAKSGRTTGFTTGTVSSINTSVSVKYPTECGGHKGPTFTFTSQVVINSSTFSAGGDSGSLIVSNNSCHQPVALLFAGSSTSTIGNPIGLVLSRLTTALGSSVTFVGGSTCSSPASLASAGQGLSEASVDFATSVMKGREKNLMSRSGVIGVGIGASDDNANEAVIVVYVDVNAKATAKVPKSINGVKVKKIFTEQFVAY